MKKIFTILTLSLSFLSLNSLGLISQELNNNSFSEKEIQEKKKNNLVLSTNSSNDKYVEILLSGIGLNPKFEKEISNKCV